MQTYPELNMTRTRRSLIVGLATCLAAVGAPSYPASSKSSSAAATPSKKKSSPYVAPMPESAKMVYALNWGVDDFSAHLAESGQLVRFSYRVTDAKKAQALNARESSPYLLDEEIHAVLQVPEMEKVGKLRQSGPPESGKSYWMVFSNKGGPVKPGHRVSVVIGQVRIDGLVVQ